MTQSMSNSSERVDSRNRYHNDSNHELSKEESDEVDSVRNMRAGNRGRRDNNINAIKIHIPLFKGKVDAKAYLEQERKVELIFACHNYFEEKKVRLATVEFLDYALIWWNELVKSRRRNRKCPLKTWEEMKD